MASEILLWDSYWHLICHRSELPTTSHYVRFDAFDAEVAAYHDGDSVVVFDNRCPHRGTRIFDGSHGKERFVCKYHGWSFARGRVIVADKASFDDCDFGGLDLARYQSAWLGDFLFASRRPARTLLEQLAGLDEILVPLSQSIASRSDFNAYPYECNWKIAVENALDQYHVGLVHRDSLNRLKLDDARDYYHGHNNISLAAIGDPAMARRLTSLSRFFDLQHQTREYMAIYLFPFTFLTSTFGYSYSLQQFYPSDEADRTHFSSRFFQARLSPKVSDRSLAPFFDAAIAVNRQVFAEDAAVCARMPTDSWSPLPHRFVSRGEAKLVRFRAAMREVLA